MDTKSGDNNNNNNKLNMLKDMMIGWRILKSKCCYDWWEYKKRNDQEWIEREGLCILLTEEMIDLMVDKSEEDIWSECHHFACSASVMSSREVQCSLVRLFKSVSDRMGRDGDCWKGHRVICWMMRYMIKWNGLCDETIDSVVDYLVKVLECDEMEMVKWAILTGERLWVKMKMKISRDRLRIALTRHSTKTHTNTLKEAMDRNWWDAERYQVEWCAKWCEENLLEDGVEEIPWTKLSRDRIEVRCNNDYTSPVRSPFTVKSNVYFYEVICLQNGDLELGWSNRETRLELFKEIGRYNHSVWLHLGAKQCFIQSNQTYHPIPTPLSPLGSLNVIGCLLDLDKGKFEFYFNGRALECPTPHLSFRHYFATARLSPHQHCHFNFGQSPFKYPPPNIRYTTFDEQSGGDVRRYRLGETKWWGGYWFAHTPVDNQESLFFCDEMQVEFDREVRKVMLEIENDRDIGEWRLRDGDYYEENCRTAVRYIQAIIEVIDKMEEDDKVDVMAQWVGQVIENNIDQARIALLFELLYPYLQLVYTKSTLTQHRSICIVLLHLIKCCRHHSYKFIEQIHREVFTYLSRTLNSTRDQWTKLFVLIALTDLEMSEHEKREIESCGKIVQMVETWRKQFEGKDVEQLIKLIINSTHEYRLQYQIYFCSHHLLTSPTFNLTNFTRTTSAILNPFHRTPHLTLSPCQLSARSDWHWQSVRSVCQVSAYIYYFEVVLLTAGPMTIGWATKRTDLDKITKIYPKGDKPLMVGFDEFSIGYDGYNRCIYHDNKTTFQLENIPRWKVGDIVGCLININQKLFKFYLNGSQINFNPKFKIYFSTQPYHALISLSQFQQVYINFGQFHFSRYRPKYIDFCDFYSNKPEVREIQTKTVVNFQNAHLEKNLISIDSNVQQEDVIITGNASELTETIGKISSVYPIASVEGVNFHSQERSRYIECRLCCSSSPTKLVHFACCNTLTLCLDCLRVVNECPKCNKKQAAFHEVDEVQPNEPKHSAPNHNFVIFPVITFICAYAFVCFASFYTK